MFINIGLIFLFLMGEVVGGLNELTSRYETGIKSISEQGRNKAIQKLKEEIKKKPNSVDLHYRLGIEYSRRGRLKEAVDEFNQALKIDSGHINSILALANIYLNLLC